MAAQAASEFELGISLYSEARFEAALSLSPHDTTLHLYLGQAYEGAGDLPAALRQYALYTKLHADDLTAPDVLPDYLNAGLKMAEISLKLNHPADAVSLYTRVAALARAHGRADSAKIAESNLRALRTSPKTSP